MGFDCFHANASRVSASIKPGELRGAVLRPATPVVQPSGAAQAAVTLGNTDGAIGGLTISDPPIQAEVQALRDKAEVV